MLDFILKKNISLTKKGEGGEDESYYYFFIGITRKMEFELGGIEDQMLNYYLGERIDNMIYRIAVVRSLFPSSNPLFRPNNNDRIDLTEEEDVSDDELPELEYYYPSDANN